MFFSVAGIGSAAPMLLPGAMTIWRHDKAIRAPADQARDVMKAIVGTCECCNKSRIRNALSTRPPCVLMRIRTAWSCCSSASFMPRCTSAACPPSISPVIVITCTVSAAYTGSCTVQTRTHKNTAKAIAHKDFLFCIGITSFIEIPSILLSWESIWNTRPAGSRWVLPAKEAGQRPIQKIHSAYHG